MSKLLFLAGSARKDSVNKKLARAAYEIAKSKGADAQFIDLKDYEMPIYCGDYQDEHGLPENAIRLKKLFIEHGGIFIASPEYNSSFSPLLKNALDWISRSHEENEKPMSAYAGKVFALSAASPGGLGGLRGLVPLRMMLSNMQVHVLPQQVAVSDAYGKFNDVGDLNDSVTLDMLNGLVDQFIDVTSRLSD